MIQTLPDIIHRQAERTPENEAFRFGGDALTYRELAHRSDALARALGTMGVSRVDHVGILSRKSLHVPVAVYGIMKAGAAYVPLDANSPKERLRAILSEAGIRVLVSSPEFDGLVSACLNDGTIGAAVGCSDSLEGIDRDRIKSWDEVFDPVKNTPGEKNGDLPDLLPTDSAYIIFTSGSTGVPKGIVHTHESGLAYAKASAALYDLSPSDRISGFPPLHFDQSTFDLFSGPYAGATTVLIPETHMMLPASLAALIETERLTVWYSVPFALIQLLLRGALESRDCSSLRWVLFGGEVFSPRHLCELMDQWPHARFSNVYGPAEVNQCTYYHVPSPWIETEVPLGTAWDAAIVLIEDERGNATEPGDSGELLVASQSMMAGYFERSELDKRAFVWRMVEGRAVRFYRTGDRVQAGDDGLLYFVGRMDRQIKIRGHRVELDEIEACLLRMDGVESAVVVVTTSDDELPRLEAHVSLVQPAPPDVDETAIAEHLRNHLPRYAIPVRIDLIESIPLAGTGKPDRQLLQQSARTN